MREMTTAAVVLAALGTVSITGASAQDVPGIEICTAEKDMTRRTSCLQSNVEFLKTTMTRMALDQQRKLDAATRQIEALKGTVAALQKTVDDLRAAQADKAAPAKDAPAPAPKDGK